MLVRIGLAVFAVIGSLALGWSLLNSHTKAHASSFIQSPTNANPWGIAIDNAGGHVWVAEPGCDASPVCSNPPQGIIGEYNLANDTQFRAFTPPTGGPTYSPVFLALDGSGNVWFTDTTHNLIGELVPGSNTWYAWHPSTGAIPYDLVFSGGNIWFTEFGTSKIGFFNITSHTFVENAIPTASSSPYGITVAPNGDIWFAENTQSKIGSFTPTPNGVIGTSGFHEYTITHPDPHLITADASGNIWFSEGFQGGIGEWTTSGVDREFNVCTPSVCSNGTHISGIAVDHSGMVWFDDSLSNRIGYLNPSSGNYSTLTVASTTNDPNPHPHDGLAVDANNNVWVSEEYSNKLDELPPGTVGPVAPGSSPTAGISPTATSTTPVSAPSGPVARTWYFAEGRVGKGFNEYLTIGNPTSTACSVDITYLYTMDGSTTPSTKTMTGVPIPANTRWTEHVNQDLKIDSTSSSAASLASIVTINSGSTCPGVVAERPLYFSNFHGISSGNDVVGGTTLNATFDFADIPTGANNTSYISILNPPGGSAATVTATYYANGVKVNSQTTSVAAGTRGTISPGSLTNLPSHVAAIVTSSSPVFIERPTYFANGPFGTSGGYDVIGAQSPAKDWYFAEGYTGGINQENLTIANLSSTTESITITLKSKTGANKAFPIALGPLSSTVWNVNANNNFTGSSPEVSAEVLATGTNIVVQREMYFKYSHSIAGYQTVQASGGDDIMGIVGPLSKSSYSFAEGYTALDYNEWLTVQNPNTTTETITITISNGSSKTQTFTENMAGNSRLTVDITQQVLNFFHPSSTDIYGNAITMTVQTLDGHPIVVERPEYWNTTNKTFKTQGGSDVFGYTG
ncbi:MAG TPA: hypothetical protein DHW02_03055 [Ktedonobacter sp.]|nr:hypothetical protein [Ktedonobacter sp.]